MAGDRLDLGTARNRLPNMSLNPLNRSVGVREGGSEREIFLILFPKYSKISSVCRNIFLSRIYSIKRLSYFCRTHFFQIIYFFKKIFQHLQFPENFKVYIIFWKTFKYIFFRKFFSSEYSLFSYSCSLFRVH